MFCVEILENGRSALLVMTESGFWMSDYRMLSHDSMTEEVQQTVCLSKTKVFKSLLVFPLK